jgi:hypothetical protein
MNPDARPQSQKSCGNADRGFLQASFGPTCDGEAGKRATRVFQFSVVTATQFSSHSERHERRPDTLGRALVAGLALIAMFDGFFGA